LQALKVAAAESEANRFAAAEQHLLRVKKEVEAAEGLGAARQVSSTVHEEVLCSACSLHGKVICSACLYRLV
jgi:hypothetical protein